MPTFDIPAEDAEAIRNVAEGHYCDVKSIDISPAKLSKTISAFANTAGGELFVGIDEREVNGEKKRSWRGFDDEEAANGILQVLEQLQAIGNYYTFQFLRADGYQGLVLNLTIQKTKTILASTDETLYVRRGAQSLPVRGEEAIRRLQLDKGLASFEDETVAVSKDSITNSVTVLEFMLGAVPAAEPDRWLKSQFVLADDKPTVAGLLLFGDEPQAAIPKRAAIKIFRYASTDDGVNRETLAFDPLTVEGPIYDLIKKAVQTTKDIVEGIKRLGEDGLEDITYPDETLHEIITNAVLHRDYSHQTDTQIRIYDDRVEVESPGSLPGHITTANILDEQFARNPKIVRLINKFPNPPNKDVGEGLNTAFEAMRKIRLKEPEILEKANSVLIQIRHQRLSSPAQIVMEYLEANGTITNQIGRTITGLRRDVQMKDVFVAMRARGLIEQVPDKRGRASEWRKAANLPVLG